jgi:TatD DNase family protein
MMSLVDTHAHLDAEAFNADRETLIRGFPEAGIDFVMTIGEDLESSQRAMRLAEIYPAVFCTVGFHPHHADTFNDSVREKLKEWLSVPKVRALGEIGLDYHYTFSSRETQKNAFRSLLRLSQEMQKPVVIHNRKSDEDLLTILRDLPPHAAVIHCFDSGISLAEACLDLGFYLSFSGIVTFKKAQELREVVRYVPLDRMLIETDCPYLAPVPRRGERNEPAFVRHVAEKIAEIKDLPLEAVAFVTRTNAYRFYEIAMKN